MECTVIGVTVETNGLTQEQLEVTKTFSGKNAGICYQKGKYFGTSVSDPDKAHKRFGVVANTNHHSIADHVQIEVLFENISKMLAIVLNSLQDYSTSEKSGRYTEMTGNSEREQELYNKWLMIFRRRILELYPDIDDSTLMKLMSDNGHSDVIVKNGELNNNTMADSDDVHINLLKELKGNSSLPSIKLSQENARYILSVFTKSTTMGYSTSLRQWNYIYDWCQKYMSAYYFNEAENKLYDRSGISLASYFETELYNDLNSLSEFIKENLYVDELRDSKNRCFDFLTSLSGDRWHPMANYDIVEPDSETGELLRDSKDDKIDITYQVSYPASFVQIAQAERHRTLKYFMMFNPFSDRHMFFIPSCIGGTKFEDEWLNDLESVKNVIPQATMVHIIETGHVSDFVLKCEERLCGRAQLETFNQTYATAQRFVDYCRSNRVSEVLESYVDDLVDNRGCVKTKCKILGTCKEPCRYCKDLSEVFVRKV